MVRYLDGIPVLDEAAIIPFKARAWFDLTKERQVGNRGDEKNIKKHRNDVAQLLQVLSPDASYPLPETVANDMVSFIQLATTESDYDPKQLKVNMTREDVAERLRAAYRL